MGVGGRGRLGGGGGGREGGAEEGGGGGRRAGGWGGAGFCLPGVNVRESWRRRRMGWYLEEWRFGGFLF